MVSRLMPIPILLLLFCAISASARPAGEIPTMVLSSEYAFPTDCAAAANFSVSVEPTSTTLAVSRGLPEIEVSIDYKGPGVCWQIYGNTTDQVAVDATGNAVGLTSGTLTLLREETDRKRGPGYLPGVSQRRIGPALGTVFSGPAFPPEMVREEFLNRPFGQVDFTNATAEELAAGQQMLASVHADIAERFDFAGTRHRMRLRLADYFTATAPGTWRFRVLLFAWPQVDWNKWDVPLDHRETVPSPEFFVTLVAEGS